MPPPVPLVIPQLNITAQLGNLNLKVPVSLDPSLLADLFHLRIQEFQEIQLFPQHLPKTNRRARESTMIRLREELAK
jgi:hypothetical protein